MCSSFPARKSPVFGRSKHIHTRASVGVTGVRSVLMTDWQCMWWWLLVYWVLNVEGGVLDRRPLKAHFQVNVTMKVGLAWCFPPQSPDIFTFLTILPVTLFLRALPKFRKAPITFIMPVRMENVTLTGQIFLKSDVRGCNYQWLIRRPTYVLYYWQRHT